MQVKTFELTSNATEQELEAVNRFLRSHRILSIDRQFHQSSGFAQWSLFVVFQPMQDFMVSPASKREKPDYREILSAEEFNRFSRLRVIRKHLADAEGVPVFAIFTNEEIANIARLENIDIKSLSTVQGIGAKRLDKYGAEVERMFKITEDETSGEPEGVDM